MIHIHVFIMVSRGVKGEEGIVREFEIDMHTLLYLKWMTGEDLLYSTGTLLNIVWQPGWKRGLGRTDICIRMAESLCCPTETITTMLISHTSIQSKKV